MKALLECENKAEAKLLLDTMVDFADQLLKIAADQKVSRKGKKSKGRPTAILA
ncbi:hypothetical protein A2U01_0059170, partial [Trifolium medium]|nr:hypothetical protein [Trifolium medium]